MTARRPFARAPRLALTVQHALAGRSTPSRARFRKWVRAALEHDATITVRIVGSREARTLNRCYRGRDYATNVLTFVFRDAPPFEGDLALCAPVVAREARAQNKRLEAHFAHLTVHGVLHLQGYDHETDADAAVMERREAAIVTKLGFPDPYENER